MSYDRLVERHALEYEQLVRKLCGGLGAPGRIDIPIEPYEVQVTESNLPRLIAELRNVYQVRAMFALEAPAWARPLPLDRETVSLLDARGPMHVLGCYSFSLQMMNYDYLGHPRFHAFACGMMAHPDAPEHVRENPELQAEFPAKELPGLSSRMIWYGQRLQPSERLRALGDKGLLA